MFLCFAVFGEKMISIVVFGVFLLVLITCYPNIIKSELLIEMKAQYGGTSSLHTEKVRLTPYEGVDPHYVGLLSNFVGQIYKNYGNDPHSKLLLLVASGMLCSQFYIQHTFFMNKVFLTVVN